MQSRDFEKIEADLTKVLRSSDQSTLKQLFEKIKGLPEEAIQYMPETVYARYLRLLAKAEEYGKK